MNLIWISIKKNYLEGIGVKKKRKNLAKTFQIHFFQEMANKDRQFFLLRIFVA